MTIVEAPARPHEPLDHPTNTNLVLVGQVLCVLVPLAIWFAPLDLEPQTKHAFAIVGLHGHRLDHPGDGLCAGRLHRLLPVLGARHRPLSGRVQRLRQRYRLVPVRCAADRRDRDPFGRGAPARLYVMLRVGITYPRILLGLIVTDFLLTFVVPSGIARVVIMAAIALGLVEAFGATRGSNVARGMFLILTYTANIFDKMIIAGAGSITARGLIEKVGGVEVLWSQWFLAFLPCSIITVLAAWRLTLWLYPPEKVSARRRLRVSCAQELRKMGPLSPQERKAALLMAAAIVLWLTDFMHHISPSVIGIGVGLFALLPHVGILEIEDMRTAQLHARVLRRRGSQHGHRDGGDQRHRRAGAARVSAWMQPFLDQYRG